MLCSLTTCRTANGYDINSLESFKENIQKVLNGSKDVDYVSGAIKDGRGNICPVTIILPTLAYKAVQTVKKKDIDDELYDEAVHKEFLRTLNIKMAEARDTLVERFNHIASQSAAAGKFMYENRTMLGYRPEEGIISALKHGTLAIGQLGLAEALQIMHGYDHTTDAGMTYAKDIEALFKKNCAEWKEAYKLNFGVYYTPAESLCHTAMKKFRTMFPEYSAENVTYIINADGEREEKNYFTNSMHVPVWYNMDPFKKIEIESQLTGYSSAGCITYVEIESGGIANVDAIEKLVDYAMEHDVPYFAVNTKIMQCKNCRERIWDRETDKCPKCGCTEYEELGRVTGYLSTTVEHFNAGKQHEYANRVEHTGQTVSL